MMRWTTVGLVAVGATALACSGRYEVGGMMDQAAGTAAVGGAASAGRAAMVAMSLGAKDSGGTAALDPADAGPSMPASACSHTGAPSPLTGPFAAPSVVWQRVAMLIWGKPVPPRASLPKSTSYAWAGDLVTQGFSDVQSTLGMSPGVNEFVSEWLGLGSIYEGTPNYLGSWDKQLLNPELPALPALLQTELGERGRIGVFTEPSWLAKHTSISQRGAAIASALFQSPVPAPPHMQNPTLDPALPDRQALENVLVNPVCQACHHLMEPRGFELGNFDAAGMYRDLDHDQPVDTTGVLQLDGGQVNYENLADFMSKAASSCDANLAFADAFLKAALVLNQVPEGSRDQLFMDNQERFREAFLNSGRSYVDLVRAYAQSPLGLDP